MATSESLEKRKEQKPESVQFWLAITAGSLFFHSVFMFGVSRSVKVAVVEPGGGAIDVEMVDASDNKAAGEPIVPASSFKPEPFRPEPTPLPEFSPEPIVKPEVREEQPIVKPEKEKPIVKPEVVQKPKAKEKKKEPIAPQPNVAKGDPEDLLKKPPKPGDPEIKSVNFQVQSLPVLTPQSQGELDGTATLAVPRFPIIEVPPNFPLRLGQTLTVTLSFSINSQTGAIDSPTFSKIPSLDDKDQERLQIAVVEALQVVMFTPPKIKVNGGAQPPESTEWKILLQLTGSK
jgi:outer membrane biosynthesis protein TonB